MGRSPRRRPGTEPQVLGGELGHREPPSAYGSFRGGYNIVTAQKRLIRPDYTGLRQSNQGFTECDKVELIRVAS